MKVFFSAGKEEKALLQIEWVIRHDVCRRTNLKKAHASSRSRAAGAIGLALKGSRYQRVLLQWYERRVARESPTRSRKDAKKRVVVLTHYKKKAPKRDQANHSPCSFEISVAPCLNSPEPPSLTKQSIAIAWTLPE